MYAFHRLCLWGIVCGLNCLVFQKVEAVCGNNFEFLIRNVTGCPAGNFAVQMAGGDKTAPFTLAAGAYSNPCLSGSSNQTWRVRYTKPGDATVYYVGTQVIAASGSFTQIDIVDTGICTNCLSGRICIKNVDNVIHEYGVFHNGVLQPIYEVSGSSDIFAGDPDGIIATGTTFFVNPGETRCVTIKCVSMAGWAIMRLDIFHDWETGNNTTNWNNTATNWTWIVDDTPTGGGTTTSTNDFTGTGTLFPGGTNGGIIFPTPSTNLAREDTLKTGFQALYDAETKGFGRLGNTLDGIKTDTRIIATNSSRIPEMYAKVGALLGWFTNANLSTNGNFNTNTESTLYTNYSADTAAIFAADGSSQSSITNYGNGFRDLADDVPDSFGEMHDIFTVPITSTTTLDVNPFHIPQVVTLALWFRNLMVWIVTVVYIAWALDYIFVVLKDARPRGNVSSFQGQFIKALLMVLMTAALASLPSILIAIINTRFGSSASLSSNPFASGTSWIITGVVMLDNVFPLKVIIYNVLSSLWFRTAAIYYMRFAAMVCRMG